MNWLERLNRAPQTAGAVDVLHWAYNPELTDNVPHRHTYFEICLVGRWGAGIFSVAGQKCEIRPGDAFFARPGVIHQIQNTGTRLMELLWVSFSLGPMGGELGALWNAFAESSVVVAPGAARLGALWDALRLVAEAPEIVGKDAQIAALGGAVTLEIAQLGAGSAAPAAPLPDGNPHAALARLAVRYFQDNLARRLSVEEVAAHVHLSPRHFARLFREFTGTSPAAYLETARMDRARHLLAHSSRSVKEIGAAVGFADVHHFSRVFARHHGVSPGAFRKNPGVFVARIEAAGDLV